MADISAITNNLYVKNSEAYASNLSSTISAGATTVPVNSAATYSDGDYVVLTVEPGTSNQATFYGQKVGSNFINCVWTEGNLAIGHSNGKPVVDYESATHYALLTKAMSAEHEADGTHGAITPTAISVGGKTFAALVTGWIDDTATWTYASATTFTVTGDVRTQFPVGTKLKLVQSSTTKYFYVTATSFSTNTTVTITGGTSYTLANATISGQQYSYGENPQGFPASFDYTPTWTNLDVGNGAMVAKFTINGKTLSLFIQVTFGSTSAMGTAPVFSLPVTAVAYNAVQRTPLGQCLLQDTGTANYPGVVLVENSTTGRLYTLNAAGTYVAETSVTASVPFSWTNTDIVLLTARYNIA